MGITRELEETQQSREGQRTCPSVRPQAWTSQRPLAAAVHRPKSRYATRPMAVRGPEWTPCPATAPPLPRHWTWSRGEGEAPRDGGF